MLIKISLTAFLVLIIPTLLFLVNLPAQAGGVEINTATLQQLDTLTGIGPAYAQAIIDARPFSSVDDLLKVKGIGEKTLQKIKDQGLAFVSEQMPISNSQITDPNQTPNPNDSPSPEATPEQSQTPTPTQQVFQEVRPPEPVGKVGPSITYPVGIILNEILPSPEGPDQENEWIEIYNQNEIEVDLSGWKLYDTEGSNNIYTFPTGKKIQGNNYLLLKRPTTKIVLNNTKDGLKIVNPGGIISDEISYTKALANQSYNRLGSVWAWSETLTPGLKNIISTKEGANQNTQASPKERVPEDKLLAILESGVPEKKDFTFTFFQGSALHPF